MTAPLSLPPDCALYVDGVRYQDGSLAGAAEPVALTDLRVDWGRDNTLDQPGPTSCTFRILDEDGGQRFRDQLHMGSKIEVFANATIYPDPTISTITDPGFEARAAGTVLPGDNVAAVVTAAKAHAGTRSVRIDAVDGLRLGRVVFPPAPYGGPSAWDAVPRSKLGQTWRVGASVWRTGALADTARVFLRPVAYTAPRADTATLLDPFEVTGAPDGWVSAAQSFQPPAGVWLGVALEVYPWGPVWAEVPAATVWNSLGATPVWSDLGAVFVDDLLMLAPAAGALRSGVVFSGRLTDMTAQWDSGLGATIVDVIAQSHLAELNNRYVGDAPWTQEGLQSRFSKIVTASGQGINWSVDPTVQTVPICYRDVDNQPAARLLEDLAGSVGGALWSAAAVSSGPFLRLEDIDARPALYTLVKSSTDNLVHIVIRSEAHGDAITVSACDALLDPVRWQQTSEDASTRVAVTWREQGTDTDGKIKMTDRTETSVNQALETATGQRRVGVSTQLAAQADAVKVGNSLLARVSTPGWRVAGLTLQVGATEKLDAATLAMIMQVLDSATRVGLGILLTDLPGWSLVAPGQDLALFLEGGRFTNTDGAWELELMTSSADSQGKADVAWNQLDAAWRWQDFAPEVLWSSLNGVTV